jgi:hypothetical protein
MNIWLRKRKFGKLAVLLTLFLAALIVTGCPQPTDDGGSSARELAEDFKAGQGKVFEKTTDTVTVDDETAVDAALAAYEDLSEGARELLTEEKTKLDSLKVKIAELKAAADAAERAAAFKTGQSGVLGKTVDTVGLADEAAVSAALTAYEDLSVEVKALLTTEKTRLDGLKARIETLKVAAGPEALAAAFRTGHSGILGKTADTVAASDETTASAALAAYEALSPEVKALLAEEKAKLDSLAAKIAELKAAASTAERAAAFKNGHSGVLGKTADTVAVSDDAAVSAALTAYEELSAEVKTLLAAEKAKLDELKEKIAELKPDTAAIAFENLGFVSFSGQTMDSTYKPNRKYFSLSTGKEVPVSKKNTAEWDIAMETVGAFFCIYTNSGYTAEVLGNTGGNAGVWFTNRTNFSDVVSIEDRVTDLTGPNAEYAPYVTDTETYQLGMDGPVPGAMNIMTYYGYEDGDGSYDHPYAISTNAPFAEPFYKFNKKAFAAAGTTMPPTWWPTNQVYIIRHADGITYSKFQVYTFYYTTGFNFWVSFRFETLTE